MPNNQPTQTQPGFGRAILSHAFTLAVGAAAGAAGVTLYAQHQAREHMNYLVNVDRWGEGVKKQPFFFGSEPAYREYSFLPPTTVVTVQGCPSDAFKLSGRGNVVVQYPPPCKQR